MIIGEHADPHHCFISGFPIGEECTAVGELSGIRCGLKDLFAISGYVSSFGSTEWRATHQPSTSTAQVVTTLLEHGTTITGMTKMDALAPSLVGNLAEGEQPINPLFPERWAGGSSSGSAVAVAAKQVDVGLGTDTAGSIRVPAAACGLYGLRPTHGAISVDGVIPLAPSFDAVGFMAQELTTLYRVASVLLPKRGAKATYPTRIFTLEWNTAPQTVWQAEVDAFAASCARARGIPHMKVDGSAWFGSHARNLFAALQPYEVQRIHGTWISGHHSALPMGIAARILSAKEPSQSEYQNRMEMTGSFLEAIATSIVIVPVLANRTPLRRASRKELQEYRATTLEWNAIASLAGCPELVLPVRSECGEVFGVGIIGPLHSDNELLGMLAQEVAMTEVEYQA